MGRVRLTRHVQLFLRVQDHKVFKTVEHMEEPEQKDYLKNVYKGRICVAFCRVHDHKMEQITYIVYITMNHVQKI